MTVVVTWLSVVAVLVFFASAILAAAGMLIGLVLGGVWVWKRLAK